MRGRHPPCQGTVRAVPGFRRDARRHRSAARRRWSCIRALPDHPGATARPAGRRAGHRHRPTASRVIDRLTSHPHRFDVAGLHGAELRMAASCNGRGQRSRPLATLVANASHGCEPPAGRPGAHRGGQGPLARPALAVGAAISADEAVELMSAEASSRSGRRLPASGRQERLELLPRWANKGDGDRDASSAREPVSRPPFPSSSGDDAHRRARIRGRRCRRGGIGQVAAWAARPPTIATPAAFPVPRREPLPAASHLLGRSSLTHGMGALPADRASDLRRHRSPLMLMSSSRSCRHRQLHDLSADRPAGAHRLVAAFPRFDAEPVFCHLLGGDAGAGGGNRAEISASSSSAASAARRAISRTPRCSSSVLEDAKGGAVEITDFAPRFKHYDRTFRPPQFVRRVRPIKGRPRIRVRLRPAPIGARGCRN